MSIYNTLAQLTEENQAFSKFTPGLQLVWDSTSLGQLKTCPYKYYLKLICGWNPKRQARPLAFGILVHECLELYEYRRLQGLSHLEAMHKVARYALEKSGTRNEDGSFSPWDPAEDDLRTRPVLLRAVVWYLDEYGENDPAKTVILANSKPAVELSFKLQTHFESPEDGAYFLSGHMDRLVKILDEIWVMDHKTTKSTLSSYYFKNFSPNNQMTLYTLASKQVFSTPAAGVLVNGIQLGKTFSRVSRGFAHRTPAQLDEWYDDLGLWLAQASLYAQRAHWPMDDESCSKYGGCEFQQICQKDPSVRETFLAADFKREIWDPTVTRGL